MPINLQGSGNIAEGWGKAPDLDAPALGPLVASILANKLARDKMLQEGIGETIKNVREERQGNALLEAMKAQGLVPEGYDAGGLGGAKLGVGLAKMIQDQREFEAREEHRRAMETRVGGRGGRGSRGDGGVSPDVPASESEIPEDYYGLSVAPGAASKETTRTINGIVHIHDAKGNWKPGPKWMQQTGESGKPASTNIAKDVKEALGLQDQFDILEKDRKKQEAEDITAGAKDPNYPQKVPFKQSDLYNMTANRLKELRAKPGMPSTEPAVPQRPPAETGNAVPTTSPPPRFIRRPDTVAPQFLRPPPADSASGHAEGYGTKAVYMKAPDGTVSPVDPNLVEHFKSKGAVIVPGP